MMRIGISNYSIKAQGDNKLLDIGPSIVSEGISEAINFQEEALYQNYIIPWRIQVGDYIKTFDKAFEDYAQANSMLRKMKNVLNPGDTASDELIIPKKKYENNKKATKNLINVMNLGHSLLLQIRKELTGQSINTKFIISVNGKTYQIDESKLTPDLVLSQFGAGTVSNPFSLAYQLNIDMIEKLKQNNELEEIGETNLWQLIRSLKRPYLDEKTKVTGRIYKNIFFDSKDAEIYTLYSRADNIETLTLSEYANLRASMGGGGGYASPFYKSGDVYDTQVKYFNIKRNTSVATVNFVRFSLLRDRMKQLYQILNQSTAQEIGLGLKSFYTEKEKNISTAINKEFNAAAQEAINQLFNL